MAWHWASSEPAANLKKNHPLCIGFSFLHGLTVSKQRVGGKLLKNTHPLYRFQLPSWPGSEQAASRRETFKKHPLCIGFSFLHGLAVSRLQTSDLLKSNPISYVLGRWWCEAKWQSLPLVWVAVLCDCGLHLLAVVFHPLLVGGRDQEIGMWHTRRSGGVRSLWNDRRRSEQVDPWHLGQPCLWCWWVLFRTLLRYGAGFFEHLERA